MTLICHAPTSTTRASAFPLDESIDDRSADSIRALAPSLAQAEHAWVSPAARAWQTAEILGLSATLETAIDDCDYGHWAGRTLEDINASEPDAVQAWMTDPDATPHGGESVVDLIRRVGRWLDDHQRDTGHAIVVTHAAVIRSAIIHVLQASPQAFWRLDVAPLTRTLLTASHGNWRLRALQPID